MTKALLDEPTEAQIAVALEWIDGGFRVPNCAERVAIRAALEALRSSTPQEPVVDDLEKLIFREAIKRGVDQDTADQIAQAVADRLQAKAPETGEE